MNAIVGFGSTEEDWTRNEENVIRAHVEEQYARFRPPYFTDSFIGDVRNWISQRAKASQIEGEKHKRAEKHPDRYSYFWAAVVADASHLVVILTIHHINRRHALSPDGWALMTEKHPILIEVLECDDKAEEQRHA